MLNKIIQFSISQKAVIGIFTLGLIFWGVHSLMRLPIDAVPDITNNQVQVITYSPSLSPQEVERLITFPIEMGVANIPELQEVRSLSRFGLSVVTIVFSEKTDVYWARQQVSERLKTIGNQIPTSLGVPELGPVSTGLSEIFQYTINPKKGFENTFSATDIRSIQDWIIRRQLLGTEGVADVSSFGGYLKQYEVAVDPERLRSYKLSLTDLFEAIQKNNQNSGGSYIAKGPQAWYIRSEGMVENLDDIGKTYVKSTDNGLPITLADVATLQFGHSIRYGALTRNDVGETVGGIVLMLKGANSNQVISSVKERMAKIEKMLPEGLEIDVYLDRSDLIGRTIHTVSKNLIEGALIVIFVLVLFLGNLRAGLLVASVIPLSMLFAIGMMDAFGVSGNLMSLGAIDFGLIVDGAVIIVEATMHHLVMKKAGFRLNQKEMDEEVYQSASKIRTSAAFGEIIILIVYLPLLALVGIEGKMFGPMAQTVSFAILGAFILSMTYVPMASSLFLSKNIKSGEGFSDKIINRINRWYQPILQFTLQFKKVVLLGVVLLFAFSLHVLSNMGGVFIPNLDEGDFAVETRLLAGSSIDKTIEVSLKAGKILRDKFPEVKEVIGKIGTSEIPTDPMGFEACDLMVLLKNRSDWPKEKTKDELADEMKAALEVIPGVNFGFQQPIQMRFNELMTGAKQDVAIKIYGEDLEELARQADKLGKIIGKVNGLADLYIENITGLPQMVAKVNREKLALYHLHVDEVNKAIETAFSGAVSGSVYEGEKRFDLVVRQHINNRQSLNDLSGLFITNQLNQQIPLNQVADVSFKLGPNQIQRDDGHRRVTVAFNVRGRDVEGLVAEIEQQLDQKFKLPVGYSYSIGGEFKNLQEAKSRLLVAVPLALSLIFFLLYFTFHSLKQGLLVFSAIPLSAIGGIWALWLRDMPFSISAGVGFIALFGVAVLNGIVLIGEFNYLKTNGLTNLFEIIKEGTKHRLRPVLMTASVASLGFLPMALSQSAGAEVQKPLATVVIGGLLTATILTLFVLPILYSISERGLRFSKPKVLGLLVILAGLASPVLAQKRKISLEDAINLAVSNHSSLQSLRQTTEAQRFLQGEAYDIGKASAQILYGQTNSSYIDNHLSLNQTIPFPTVFQRQKEWLEGKVQTASWSEKVAENELIFQVKSNFNKWQHNLRMARFLQSQDSLFAQILVFTEKRLAAGEGTLLEKAIAQNQWIEIRSKIRQQNGQRLIIENQLQYWLQTQDSLEPIFKTENEPTQLSFLTNQLPDNQPRIKLGQQQVQVLKSLGRVEKSRLLPDISVGYFNQSLTGSGSDGSNYSSSRRFQGLQAGLHFHLWARPQLARIKAAEAMSKAADSDLTAVKNNLNAERKAILLNFELAKDYFETLRDTEMPIAVLIKSQAMKAFQMGQIGMLELSQAIKRSMDTEERLLEAANQLKIQRINFEHINGNQ